MPQTRGQIVHCKIEDNDLGMRGTVRATCLAARAMAPLGNYTFQGATGPAPFALEDFYKDVVDSTSWMEYLPKQREASPNSHT